MDREGYIFRGLYMCVCVCLTSKEKQDMNLRENKKRRGKGEVGGREKGGNNIIISKNYIHLTIHFFHIFLIFQHMKIPFLQHLITKKNRLGHS